MNFRIKGLDVTPFRHYFGLSDAELATHGVKRYRATTKPEVPDRVELRDAEPGETALLLNFVHQPAATPYRSSHAIFVLEGAETTYDRVNEIPEVLRVRPISVRAFDRSHMMVAATLASGAELEDAFRDMLREEGVAYLHAHYAKRGCYAALIEPV